MDKVVAILRNPNDQQSVLFTDKSVKSIFRLKSLISLQTEKTAQRSGLCAELRMSLPACVYAFVCTVSKISHDSVKNC